MKLVTEDRDKTAAKSSIVGGKRLAKPMERLHEAHGRASRPVEAAGRSVMKIEDQIAELNGPQAPIGEDLDARRNCIGQSKVVGGRDAIEEDAHLAPASQSIDHIARIGRSGLAGKAVDSRNVIEAASDAAHVAS